MITKLELDLSQTFRKMYHLQTWGYYVREAPSKTDVYFQIGSNIIDIDFKPKFISNRKIDQFVITNKTPMLNQRLVIYVSDELSDFEDLVEPPIIMPDIDYPTGSIQGVEDAVNDANTAITSRQDISNSHLSDIKTYTDGIEGILNSLNGKDFSTETTLNQVKLALDDLKTYTDGLETALTTLNSKDFATQTTLNQVKLALDDIKTYVDGLETSLETLNSKDFATQATLSALNAKDFSTETTLSQVKLALDDIKTYVDGLETSLDTLNSKDFATQTTLNQVKLALDDIKTYVDGLETSLETLNSKDFATQATLSALNDKVDTSNNLLQNILNELTEPTIIFDTTEQFTGINTTVDFTVTLSNNAVFDPNDYRKTASCVDSNLLNYTCAYYNDTTKEITFTARPDGSTSTTITISYQKAV